MPRIQCNQCLKVEVVPPGVDPHTITWCECCTIKNPNGTPHHHGQAAASCSGNGGVGHPEEPCPHPNPAVCAVVSRPVHPDDPTDHPGPTRTMGDPCPGGHCGVGVNGCTVCRPVTHFAEAGPLDLVSG